MKLIQAALTMLVLCAPAWAQEAANTSIATGAEQATKVRSPEVLPDRRVTFRLVAPKASEVLLVGNWPGGRDVPMTKDASGLWSVTTAALQPELWAYTFSVDGVRTLDPNNYNVVRDGVGFMNTLLVPDDSTTVFQPRAVPHGTVTTVWIPSTEHENAASRIRVHTARLRSRHDQVPGAVPVARQRRRRSGVARHGHRQRHHGQPDRSGKGQADDRGHAQRLWDEYASLDLAGPRKAAPPGVGSAAPAAERRCQHTGHRRRPDSVRGQELPHGAGPREPRAGRPVDGLRHFRERRTEAAGCVCIGGPAQRRRFPQLRDLARRRRWLESINPEFKTDAVGTNKKLNLLFMSCGTEDPRVDAMTQASEGPARTQDRASRTRPTRASTSGRSGAIRWPTWRRCCSDNDIPVAGW